LSSIGETYRVLVVEDDSDTRANLADILELDGFEVLAAATAKEALSRTDWETISIVLLDRKLPDGNALELLPRLKALAPQATVMVVTGLLDLEGAITALRSGAADYILKPVNADALRASVARVIDRLRIERELRESQRQLEEERKRALQNERLAAIGETMTALIHESRNALQRSKACLEMLALEVQTQPKALDLVQRTQRAQDDMHQLYEEVRQYAAPIILSRRSCNLAESWRDAWQHLSQEVQAKHVQLREEFATQEVQIHVDPFAIRQVWRNIFENAIAASPPGGIVELHCDNTLLNGRPALKISIQDRGPGLNEEQKRCIFSAFFTTKTKGTGLGMAIAQRIVHSHSGQICADNSPTGGAKIEVILPRDQKHE
jgi:signal transduction histidine kinase